MGDWPKTVRTTIQPETDIQVEAHEHAELAAQGLILPGHDGEYRGEVPTRRNVRATDTTKTTEEA